MASQISAHTIDVVHALRTGRRQWLSSHDVHRRTRASAPRTVRGVLTRLVDARVVEYVEVFPGRRYRLAETAEAEAYLRRVAVAAEALGLG